MRYFKKIILVVIMSAFICLPVKAEMTLKELFFDESKPFHLKILDVIPEEGIVQIGDENANNTIIEFIITNKLIISEHIKTSLKGYSF